MDSPESTHVRLSNVHKSFDTDAERLEVVAGVSLDIRAGEFVCLLGPSGCGKSTLLRLISGLVRPDAGQIYVNGQSPVDARSNHSFGLVSQEPALLPWRSVVANVRLPLDLDTHSSDDLSRQGVDDLLRMVGMDRYADYYPHQLSGGMQQRTALARALAVGAPLLLMDEPFGGLDEITRAAMRYELLRIWDIDQKTVVFVTHSISEAVTLSDRVVVLSGRPGRVIGDVPIDLPRPRSSSIERGPDFLAYSGLLHDTLRQASPTESVAVG